MSRSRPRGCSFTLSPAPQASRWTGSLGPGLGRQRRNGVCLRGGSECLQTRLGARLETGRKGAEWVPWWMWEVCLDCELAGVLTPPRLLSSSVFPRGSCAPSVVHGRAVKMLLPHLFSSLPSSPPPPSPPPRFTHVAVYIPTLPALLLRMVFAHV